MSDNDDNSQTSGVNAEIPGVARVLDDSLGDMPINKNIIDASNNDNDKISDCEESHNDKIPFENVYHPKKHPNSTIPSH